MNIFSFEYAEKNAFLSIIETDHRSTNCNNISPSFASKNISIDTSKDRPILIYIYSTNAPKIFSSDILAQFLAENYIVWSWNISNPVDQQELIKFWEEYFPKQSTIDLSIDHCPLLIAIMKSFSVNKNSWFECVPEVLLIGDVLVRTNEEFDLESLLSELILFKEEFDRNERYLSSDFVQKIVPCSELVLTISKYLSLNDAVATFSPDVLPLLWNYNQKLPVFGPTREFLNSMEKTHHLDKIIALKVNVDQLNAELNSMLVDKFSPMKILPYKYDRNLSQIFLTENDFANLTYLSLFCEGEIHFGKLCLILNIVPDSVKYLKIHCESLECSYCSLNIVDNVEIRSNQTVDSFVLKFNITSQSMKNPCCSDYPNCLQTDIIKFIKLMPNVENVRIFSKESIRAFFDLFKWMDLMQSCPRLKRIKLQGKCNVES